jgi:hypothetical protein
MLKLATLQTAFTGNSKTETVVLAEKAGKSDPLLHLQMSQSVVMCTWHAGCCLASIGTPWHHANI